jgi:hypothetical protein
MPSDITFRPATAADVEAYHGKPSPFSFRGYAAVKGSEVVGVGGVYYDGRARIAFSEFKEEMRSDRRALVRGTRMLMKFIDTIKGPVYAVADPNEPTAAALLSRLGWKPTGVFGPRGETLVRG